MTLGAEDLMRLDTAWAQWTAEEVEAWMNRVEVSKPHVVGSHGHTVFHRPDEGWTCQIGHGAVLHAQLGVPVVSDLRSLDVATGGQGAPLVPLADQMLFGDWDVALNLGGFANLSLDARPIPGGMGCRTGKLALESTGPNGGVGHGPRRGHGRRRTILPDLLKTWQVLLFHAQTAPKSLGREWLEQELWPHAEQALHAHSLNDASATAVAYASCRARDVLRIARMVTGGSAIPP